MAKYIDNTNLGYLISKIKAAFWPKADVTNVTLADVAVTGDYDDLTNKPTIPGPEIFWATYGTTTAAEIDAAVQAGKAVMCRYNNRDYALAFYDPTNAYIYFGHVYASNLGYVYVTRSTGTWGIGLRTPEQITNKVTSWQATPSDAKYPSEKLVKDSLDAKYTKPSTGIPASDLAAGVIPSVPVQDVTVGGTSVVSNGTAVLPTIPEYYDAIYDVTTSAQLKEAHDAGKTLRLIYNDMIVPMVSYTYTSGTRGSGGGGSNPEPPTPQAAYLNVVFGTTYGSTVYTFSLTGVAGIDTWSNVNDSLQPTANRVTSLSRTSTNTQYPSAKATYNAIHPTIATTQPAGGFLPNIVYDLGTLSGNTTFTLATPADANIVNHYYWTFDTGSTAPTITWPTGLTWFGGSAPTINASKHYEISVLNGIGVAMEV